MLGALPAELEARYTRCMPAEQADELRQSFVSAARSYYEEQTPATSAARASVWAKARKAGVREDTIREWDEQAAREVLPPSMFRPSV